jgi:toxin HigB-1
MIQTNEVFALIVSFADKRTHDIATGKVGKGFPPDIVKRAQLLLNYLETIQFLDDLRSPPGNRLEKLGGDRAGQYSIRINNQWRICFVWTPKGPENVEVIDYH